MKTLILVRHGKSSWDDPGLDDFDRPLAKRGLRDAPEMAKRLARRGPRPDVIVTSPARRALATAEIFADILEMGDDRLITDRRIYEADVPTLLTVVNELNDTWSCVALAGHNPGFTQLAATLNAQAPHNIPTSGCAVLSLPVESWTTVHTGTLAELAFDYPKRKKPAPPQSA